MVEECSTCGQVTERHGNPLPPNCPECGHTIPGVKAAAPGVSDLVYVRGKKLREVCGGAVIRFSTANGPFDLEMEREDYTHEVVAPKTAPVDALHVGDELDALAEDIDRNGLMGPSSDALWSKAYNEGIKYGRMNPVPLAKPTHAVGVSVLVTNGDSVLLGERINNTAAGLLSTPGGRIEPNETILDCAVRETLEETGLSLTRDLLEVVAWREHFRFGGHYFMFYVHAPQSFGALVNTEPDKCKGWNWHKIADVKADSTTEPIDIMQSLRSLPPAERKA